VIQLEVPAKPGDVLNIWSNGVGAVQGDEAATPLPGDLTNVNLEAWVGTQQAQILYRGRSGCCSALDQIVIKLPTTLPSSCVVRSISRTRIS